MSNKSGTSSQVISLPSGGGALQGIGETFAPDLHTGTGNFTVPIALPPGRNGFQPQISLLYSTGNGNGPFGLGWSLSIPGVSRKTSKGVPRYQDAAQKLKERDTFILSGAEDLIPITDRNAEGVIRYRPRTEGLFARIEQQQNAENDYWEVRSKDGLVSFYGTRGAAGTDPAVVADPDTRGKVCSWMLSRTEDPFGNHIRYSYMRDSDVDALRDPSLPPPQEDETQFHHWDELYLAQIRYVDYEKDGINYLVSITCFYEERPDPFSSYRCGFEMRTRLRCTSIEIRTHADQERLVRRYNLVYLDQRVDLADLPVRLPLNGASVLSQIRVEGIDETQLAGAQTQALPPLEFHYTRFRPEKQDFFAVEGREQPTRSLANPDLELTDLFGNALPDIIEMNGAVRYWRNLGNGRFDIPRPMKEAPAGFSLADPEVQLMDADGDGRIDLLVHQNGLSGYFLLRFDGEWDQRSFQRQHLAPSFSFADPEVQLVDLNGDGVTDAIRSGERLEHFFNDPKDGWNNVRLRVRRDLDEFPNVNFSDPRVKLGDMSGDGLQDIVLIHDGNVEYWPNLGHGDWGRRIHMHNGPRFPYNYDPRRILVGDVDGDGLDDIVYVDDSRVLLWINQSGNRWRDPIEIDGTPPLTDVDAVRLVDLLGSGVPGVLWSMDATLPGRDHLFFLDFTGGLKPYLLNEMDNHMGAVTRIEYQPSTYFYLVDAHSPTTCWRTPLPFPVLVVACVEVIDRISSGKLTTEYRYHHGYWDGAEREFRGFGMVEQVDTETFERYSTAGLHGEGVAFETVEEQHFSPPVLTKTWFHQGPIGDEFGGWYEADYSDEYWDGDPPLLGGLRPNLTAILGAPDTQTQRRIKRDALRAVRGSILRTELYALDGSEREERPYTVTESQYDVREVAASSEGNGERHHIFFPHLVAQRTTQWERGAEPMTRFSFTDAYDEYGLPGKQTALAVPRRRDFGVAAPAAEPYLGALTITTYSQRDDAERYIVDRVASVTAQEIVNDGRLALFDLYQQVRAGNAQLDLFAESFNYYDGEAFVGLPVGQLGDFGALVRTEALVLTTEILQAVYRNEDDPNVPTLPPYLDPSGVPDWTPEYPLEFQSQLPPLAGYIFRPDESGDGGRYYVQTARTQYDFHVNPAAARGLPLAMRDPLGNDTSVDYDHPFNVMPIRVTDVVALTTEAEYDYRVMHPHLVTDPNQNQTAYRFTPLGLLREIQVMGKEEEPIGDRNGPPSTRFEYNFKPYLQFNLALEFQADLDSGAISARLAQALASNGFTPSAQASVTVLQPGNAWRIVDDGQSSIVLRREENLAFKGQPISVQTMRREHHASETDIPLPQREMIIETIEYSDGFGRLVQTRTQAEDMLFGDADLDAPLFGNDVLPADQGDTSSTLAPVVGRQRDPNDPPNVVVSGWQIYDNKGQVIEKFEPFFSRGFEYLSPEEEQALFERNALGQKVTMFYDPRGQVIRIVNPDGSEQRVIYGVPGTILDPNLNIPDLFEPTPWEAYTYDANDNAARTHPADPRNSHYRHHHDTPGSIVIDALGRTILAVERNRAVPEPPNGPLPPIEEHLTRSTYDIRGNLLTVTDALGRGAFRYTYDLANNPLRIQNIDAGVRRVILDAVGNEVERRDSKGALILQAYDVLNRPSRLWARDDDLAASGVTLREHLIYGDSDEAGLPDAANRNLLGKLYQHYDEAGLLTFEAYDFKGNLQEKARRVISDEAILAVFNPPRTGLLGRLLGVLSPPPDWQTPAFRVTWQPPSDATLADLEDTLLDPTEYRTSMTYDALNRVKMMRYPQELDGERKGLRPHYNRAGALERVELDGETYVAHIAYNAKGQRTLIALGNGVMTRYAYHSQTFRLLRLRSERYTQPDLLTYQPAGGLLQDFAYQYDLVGNILYLTDRVPGSGVQNNPQAVEIEDPVLRSLVAAGDALVRRFDYDAIYRLAAATGRECRNIARPQPWIDDPQRCGFNGGNHGTPNQDNAPNLTTVYSEAYTYDAVGNMSELRHNSGSGTFVRRFELVPDPAGGPRNNRLRRVTIGRADFAYTYDDNGNLISEASSRHFEWDHSDQMKSYRTQAGASEPSVEARYLYDAGGQRVKKLVRRQGGHLESTTYIDGIFEHHRWQGNGGHAGENSHLHIMDDQQRVALVRVGSAHPDDHGPAVQYHLGDHLGSSNLVVDRAGGFVNREEYFPYGETSFGSFARKRYRFTSKERDEESGLYYHGARYYAPWLGRWASCDPAGSVDGINLYCYVRSSPLLLVDTTGTQSQSKPFIVDAEEAGIAPQEGVRLPESSDPQVTLTESDSGESRRVRFHDIRKARNYVDNMIVSVEAHVENVWSLRIDKLVFRLADNSVLHVPWNAIDFNPTPYSDSYEFVQNRGIIYPLGKNGAYAFDIYNTPNIVREAYRAENRRSLAIQTRVEFASMVYTFAGAIGGLAGVFSMTKTTLPRFEPVGRFGGSGAGGGGGRGSEGGGAQDKGWSRVSHWTTPAGAKAWVGRYSIPQPPRFSSSHKLDVTKFGARHPGSGAGRVRVDFSVPSHALKSAGRADWYTIFNKGISIPIRDVKINP
jgi:RHS repeat-associated protein